MQAPEPQVLAATDRALALAPPGPRHDLAHGVWLFVRGNFRDARLALEPVEAASPAAPAWSDADQQELLYYLGEANWHDGRHDAGFAYFKRALELDRQFRPATIHAWEYPTARRDAERSRYYIGLAGESTQWLEYSLGHYAELADHGAGQFKLWAELALGQTPAPDLEPSATDASVDAHAYRIARAAEAGNLDAARREFADAWTALSAQTPEQITAQLFSLELLGEVLLCARLTPESQQLVSLLAAQSKDHPARGYHRLSILAAPLVGDAALVVRDRLTEREARLADASDAELAGDHARAAAILGELVADPTFAWDYPERAALLRNLRALHRAKDAAALCSDTMKPAIFHTAYLAMRHACKK